MYLEYQIGGGTTPFKIQISCRPMSSEREFWIRI